MTSLHDHGHDDDSHDEIRHDHMTTHDEMRTCYYLANKAIADLMPDAFLCDEEGVPAGTWLLVRINVPLNERGNGHGTRLLHRVLADADRHGIPIALVPASTGPMTQEELREWYWRNGFDSVGIYLLRMPRDPGTHPSMNPPEIRQRFR